MRRESVWKKVCCLIMAATMVTGLAGCADKSDSASAKSTATAETKETADSAKASDSKEVTKVKVGTGNGAAPFCYLDEDGNPVGYDLDVLAELDKKLENYEFEIEAMDFSTLIVSIDSGAIDMISHQLVKSEARKEKYLFPEQYYCLSPMSLCVKNDSGINTMADMAGKSLDQNPSAYEYQMLLAYNAAHPGNEVVINAVSDQTVADGYKKVSNGQVDASLTYQATYDSVIKDLGIDNLVLTDVVMCEDTYMMFGKNNAELCSAVDEALKEMIDDGTLSKISQTWFSEDVFMEYADMVTIIPEE